MDVVLRGEAPAGRTSWRPREEVRMGKEDVVLEEVVVLLERLIAACLSGELEATPMQVGALLGALEALSSRDPVRDTTV